MLLEISIISFKLGGALRVSSLAQKSSSRFDAINARSSMSAAKPDEASTMIYDSRASFFSLLSAAHDFLYVKDSSESLPLLPSQA